MIKVLAFLAKMILLYYLGFVLGIGSYDPQSSLLGQNWRVWIFLYLPLAMGIESLIATIAEVIRPAKEKESDND